jgi:hypothetical protein
MINRTSKIEKVWFEINKLVFWGGYAETRPFEGSESIFDPFRPFEAHLKRK